MEKNTVAVPNPAYNPRNEDLLQEVYPYRVPDEWNLFEIFNKICLDWRWIWVILWDFICTRRERNCCCLNLADNLFILDLNGGHPLSELFVLTLFISIPNLIVYAGSVNMKIRIKWVIDFMKVKDPNIEKTGNDSRLNIKAKM